MPSSRSNEGGQDELWRLVQAAFRERRKMLHNVLRRQLPVPAERVDAALAAVGIAPDRRPQTVSVEEWLALREALGPLGLDTRGRPAAERAGDSTEDPRATPTGPIGGPGDGREERTGLVAEAETPGDGREAGA